ncbi:MAG: phosphoglycerate mutase family protein, partial [Actinomycetota bacterium]
GHARARELVSVFEGRPAVRIMSSPATRCVQTVSPLAAAAGMEVEESQDLWEGSRIDDALTALEIDGNGAVVACSHGDIIPGLIEMLGAKGVRVTGRGCELGSIWVLRFENGRWVDARYGGITNEQLEPSA